MKKQKMNVPALVLSGLFLLSLNSFSQDSNFHIYLCFGQSNMEGQGTIESIDKTVDSRFKVMQSVECSNLSRTKGLWYDAVPPLTRCYSGLSPADYFGRTMVANLPDSIKIGIINVSVAGCKIELFDKHNYETYAATVESWMTNIINEYGGNPYAHLVEAAKLAQQDGVIKGILMHQGESNTGDNQWPLKVKGVYDNLIADLGLIADSIPLLAGEVVHADQNGICASMNSIIAKLPQTIPNSYVISSSKCSDGPDNVHFNSAGYRKLGIRYAIQMLSLVGIDIEEPEDPELPEGTEAVFLEPECGSSIGENWNLVPTDYASNRYYVEVKPGIQSKNTAAESSAGLITIPFTIEADAVFNLYARLNCPTADDDSFWMKMDDGNFSMFNGLVTSGWRWMNLNTYTLAAGDHTLTISYREDGAKMDKLCVSNYPDAPDGMGADASNKCSNVGISEIKNADGYVLGQNYPNPIEGKTMISFEIPKSTFVSLIVFDIRGVELVELAGKEYVAGKHFAEFSSNSLSDGIYFYTLKTSDFTESKKMLIESM